MLEFQSYRKMFGYITVVCLEKLSTCLFSFSDPLFLLTCGFQYGIRASPGRAIATASCASCLLNLSAISVGDALLINNQRRVCSVNLKSVSELLSQSAISVGGALSMAISIGDGLSVGTQSRTIAAALTQARPAAAARVIHLCKTALFTHQRGSLRWNWVLEVCSWGSTRLWAG